MKKDTETNQCESTIYIDRQTDGHTQTDRKIDRKTDRDIKRLFFNFFILRTFINTYFQNDHYFVNYNNIGNIYLVKCFKYIYISEYLYISILTHQYTASSIIT